MNFRELSIMALGIVCLAGCGSDDSTETPAPSSITVLDLEDLTTDPAAYEWFDFRENVKKLILSGAAETEHVAILWYTITEGSVGLHYHSKTESVYVIDGTQTDAKGVYPTGTVYFNPPGSGHQISDSTGFFILAYASPPDFANTSLIAEYTPIRIDTNALDLTSVYPFEQKKAGLGIYTAPLDPAGGMSAEFIEITSSEDYAYAGNYLLVLEGRCDIDGVTFGQDMLVVAKTVEQRRYTVTATENGACLAMGVSF
jgi:hypothetical protein